MSGDLGAFLALAPGEQQMLALFTVAHESLNRTKLAELLGAADIRDERNRAIGTSKLAEHISHWIELGLVYELGERGYGRYRVSERLIHPLFGLLRERGELTRWSSALRAHTPLRSRYGYPHPETLARELLLSLYLTDPELGPDELCKLSASYYTRSAHDDLLLRALGSHAPLPIIQRLGLPLAERYLADLFERSVLKLCAVGEGPLSFVQAASDVIDSQPLSLAAAYLALAGDDERALRLAQRDDAPTCAARCLVALTRARFDLARVEAARAIEHTRTKTSKKLKGLKGWLSGWASVALLTDRDPRSVALAHAQLQTIKRAPAGHEGVHTALLLLAHAVQGEKLVTSSLSSHVHSVERWDEILIWRILAQVAQAELPPFFFEGAATQASLAAEEGFGWVAAELSALKAAEGLGTLYRPEEPWQRALRALEAAITLADVAPAVSAGASSSSERLVWTLSVASDGGYQVVARVQTALASGWSGGRQLSWKRLAEATQDAPWLSAADAPALKHIRAPDPRRYQPGHAPGEELALALIGHPRVFADAEGRQPLEVVRGTVRVEVQARGDRLRITLGPRTCHTRSVVCERDGSGRVLVYALTPAQRAIAEQLGDHGLELPVAARDSVQRVIALMVAHFPISSELGIDAAHIEEAPADPRIHVGLSRMGAGLRVRLFVAPIGPAQTFLPGEGSTSVLGSTSDERGVRSVRAQRDLSDERRRVARLFEECPTLAAEGSERRELRIEDLEVCLELLSELRNADDVVLAWSEGAPLQLTDERALRDVRLKLGSAESWLAADGVLEVDELTKLSLRALLEAKQRRGRFVLLDDGRYLALTNELARTLELLAPLAKLHEDKVELHPLALLHLTHLEQHQLETDRATTSRLERLSEASLLEPEPPATFEATLRPYQEQGYAWLKRLAHWGAGACLADDMGLGKTLQALALLVEHAPRGPALVVAPTSVCENWLYEAHRFAPTLRVSRFAAEREKTLRELGPFDVLVCSYGILQQEIERLEQVRFEVAILDEAQAIKNLTALRTKAALRLRASVRLALTGTPVENHLGELYSLMRFLNPGLLGSGKQFETRFGRPIQRDRDRAAAQLLKRLIKPFVLRRKKSEVLDDLPQKTLITLHIEPSNEERALYAALREQALAKVAAPSPTARGRVQVLAELMRLRRAACHPRLVLPETNVASSKLNAFEELVEDLRQGGHRALVFSQFVDQLTIVRERLDELGISYQYLDGSSSPQSRAQSVKAFQAGAGELFLISLKAGGFGLNLTAADYVVHLDPWWNPAVEDQASDRAHRIGQTRPVTVYRLVMQGSIEEKILALHEHKRDLADALLEGTGGAAPLSVDELVALLRESADGGALRPLPARRPSDPPELRD
jgi:superfamily II DNA or RNA helicase